MVLGFRFDRFFIFILFRQKKRELKKAEKASLKQTESSSKKARKEILDSNGEDDLSGILTNPQNLKNNK